MSRANAILSRIRILEQEIETYCSEGRGRRQQEATLRRELLLLLATGEPPEVLPACSRLARRTCGVLQRAVTRTYALPKALYDWAQFSRSERRARERWRVPRRLFENTRRLSLELNADLSNVYDRFLPEEHAWIAEVQQDHEELEVWITDRALEDILLSTLEGYAVSPGGGKRYTEVYGICFGTSRVVERRRLGHGYHDVRYVQITRAAPQIRAKVAATWALPSDKSLGIQKILAELLFPHLEIVGDYHSHPYASLDRLTHHRGWEFSRQDELRSTRWVNEVKRLGYSPRVGLVIAVTRGTKAVRSRGRVRDHVTHIGIKNFHFFLSAYRSLADGSSSVSDVRLHCPYVT